MLIILTVYVKDDARYHSSHKHGLIPDGVYNPVRSEVSAIADVDSGTREKSNRWVTAML